MYVVYVAEQSLALHVGSDPSRAARPSAMVDCLPSVDSHDEDERPTDFTLARQRDRYGFDGGATEPEHPN